MSTITLSDIVLDSDEDTVDYVDGFHVIELPTYRVDDLATEGPTDNFGRVKAWDAADAANEYNQLVSTRRVRVYEGRKPNVALVQDLVQGVQNGDRFTVGFRGMVNATPVDRRAGLAVNTVKACINEGLVEVLDVNVNNWSLGTAVMKAFKQGIASMDAPRAHRWVCDLHTQVVRDGLSTTGPFASQLAELATNLHRQIQAEAREAQRAAAKAERDAKRSAKRKPRPGQPGAVLVARPAPKASAKRNRNRRRHNRAA